MKYRLPGSIATVITLTATLVMGSPAVYAGLEADVGSVSRLKLDLHESGLQKSCEWDLITTLHNNWFSVEEDPERMDATFIVTIVGKKRAIGYGADYRATVQGKADEHIWQKHGRENSLTPSNLCEDVADSIIHDLEDFRDDLLHH